MVQRQLLPALRGAATKEPLLADDPEVRVVVSPSVVAGPSESPPAGGAARERIVSLGTILLAQAAVDATLVAGRLGSTRSALEGVSAYFTYLAGLADRRERVVEPGETLVLRMSFADFMQVPVTAQREWEQDPIFRQQRAEMHAAALAWSIAHQFVHAAIRAPRDSVAHDESTRGRWLEVPHDILTLRLLKTAKLLSSPPVAALRLEAVLEAKPGPKRWVSVRCRTLSLSYLAVTARLDLLEAPAFDKDAQRGLADQLAMANCD